MNQKIEYIASGIGFTKLTTNYFKDPTLQNVAADVLKYLNTSYETHSFGMLYNAMTEASNGKIFERYKDSVEAIHSDSGGLQIAQKKLSMTDELVKKIYDAQIRASHVAMSFDVIPIAPTKKVAKRQDMTSKVFVIDQIDASAKQSGIYLRQQIEYFVKHRERHLYGCKPLMILHGNERADFQKFFDILIEQIPSDYYSEIGGFAIAGTANGSGLMESLDSVFSFLSLDIPPEIGHRLHFLGYGSIQRLLPILSLYRSGVLSQYHISYDSTSHTSSQQYGYVFDESLTYADFGKKPFNDSAKKIYGNIFDRFEKQILKYYNIDRDRWIQITTADLVTSVRYHPENLEGHMNRLAALLNAAYSIDNFIRGLDLYIRGKKTSIPALNKKQKVFSFIEKCSSADEWFNNYRNELSGILSSNKIKRIKSVDHITNLNEYF